jgi:hypothetical protein
MENVKLGNVYFQENYNEGKSQESDNEGRPRTQTVIYTGENTGIGDAIVKLNEDIVEANNNRIDNDRIDNDRINNGVYNQVCNKCKNCSLYPQYPSTSASRKSRALSQP